MNALISQCKKKGKGLSNEYLETLKKSFNEPLIDEVTRKDGFSYFHNGKRRNARIAKIAFDNHNRIYLEFNYVNLDGMSNFEEYEQKVWKLSDHERNSFHARGVTYCYVGENLSFALQLIEEAKRNVR